MRDPVSGPIDFTFFLLALIIMLCLAFDPRKVFEVLNSYARVKPPSGAIFVSLRVIAVVCATGLAILLIGHLTRFR